MFIVIWKLVRRHSLIDCVHRPGAGVAFGAAVPFPKRQNASPRRGLRQSGCAAIGSTPARNRAFISHPKKKYAVQKAGMAFCAAHLYFFAEQWSCRSPLHLSCRAGHSKSFGCRHLQTAGDRLLLYRPHRLSLSPPTKNFGAFSTFFACRTRPGTTFFRAFRLLSCPFRNSTAPGKSRSIKTAARAVAAFPPASPLTPARGHL